MTPRDRYIAALRFGSPERVPLLPGGPRQSTLGAWHAQGLGEHTEYRDALAALLDVPREAFDATVGVPQVLRMVPTFEEEVLEHKDGHYIVRDWMGAITEISDEFDYTYIRNAIDFVTRKWHRFPVQTRDDWENEMRWRYDPNDVARFPADFADTCAALEASERAVTVSLNGPFWQLREWVGMEPLCTMMIDDPEFVMDMIDLWREFTLATLEKIMRQVRVDALMVSEDMAYKAHSMISPAMARRFLQPTYLAWNELLRSYDVPLYDMDSDGYIGELIPVWIESGINCCNPIEIAADNNLLAFRERFGTQIAYHGAIDKRAIAEGGSALEHAVMDLVPEMYRQGGFVPSCDHGVPPDISWANFCIYTRMLAELNGWL